MSQANELTNQIIDFIYSSGGFGFRASSQGTYDAKIKSYRSAPKKGVADILALHRGRFIAIEVKIGKDRLSPEQTGFLQNISHYGGLTFVAKDFDSFRLWWDQSVALPL